VLPPPPERVAVDTNNTWPRPELNPKNGDIPDPMEKVLEAGVASAERDLADPNLSPQNRELFGRILAERKQQLAEHRTNTFLWAQLRSAMRSKDKKAIAAAESAVADNLSAQLGRIQGKTYPKGMSLEAVSQEYQKQIHGNRFDRHKILLSVLAVLTIVPLGAIAWFLIRRRRTPPAAS
jgi:hypothetical protein